MSLPFWRKGDHAGLERLSDFERLRLTARWWSDVFWMKVDPWLAPLGPRAFIAAHWPWPVKKPWQRDELFLSAPFGFGDQLMAMVVLGEIRRLNPACRITFWTRHGTLFDGLDLVDDLRPLEGETPWELRWKLITLGYGQKIPPPYPLVTMMAASVGIELMDPPVPPVLKGVPRDALRERAAGIPRPRIVVQTRSGGWTRNKDWPAAHWRDLADRLQGVGHVLDTGERTALEGFSGTGFHSFVGQTTPAEFAWLMGQADVFVGPSSAGMHVAAAHGIPAVILFGGYESPSGYRYRNVRAFYNAVPCAPCWLTTECPHDRKCLRGMAVEPVFQAVREALAHRALS